MASQNQIHFLSPVRICLFRAFLYESKYNDIEAAITHTHSPTHALGGKHFISQTYCVYMRHLFAMPVRFIFHFVKKFLTTIKIQKNHWNPFEIWLGALMDPNANNTVCAFLLIQFIHHLLLFPSMFGRCICCCIANNHVGCSSSMPCCDWQLWCRAFWRILPPCSSRWDQSDFCMENFHWSNANKNSKKEGKRLGCNPFPQNTLRHRQLFDCANMSVRFHPSFWPFAVNLVGLFWHKLCWVRFRCSPHDRPAVRADRCPTRNVVHRVGSPFLRHFHCMVNFH